MLQLTVKIGIGNEKELLLGKVGNGEIPLPLLTIPRVLLKSSPASHPWLQVSLYYFRQETGVDNVGQLFRAIPGG
jgi:hypothetical protein